MTDATWEKLMAADRLLLYGLLDQAEAAYSAVLEAEPGSAEAAFGLARVAVERGDVELAHERAQLSVRLNPRNDDAQRLLVRLTEILEARRAGPPAHQRPSAVRPSEQTAFMRNPSMADHRAREDKKEHT